MTSLCTDELLAARDTASVGEYLNWDSGLFGIRIGRVAGNQLDQERAETILAWAQQYSLDCLYFLAQIHGPTIRVAEKNGFRLVDVRTTLEARLLGSFSGRWDDDGVREAIPADIPTLREIASTSHTDSRFYRDGRFARPACDELYRIWIEKSCRGYADIVLVAEHESRPAGYVSCHLKEDGSGQIGLLGIDSRARSLGLGKKLVRHAMCWFRDREAREVTAVTPGNNIADQRLYQRSGFLTRSVQLWYHCWPSECLEIDR